MEVAAKSYFILVITGFFALWLKPSLTGNSALRPSTTKFCDCLRMCSCCREWRWNKVNYFQHELHQVLKPPHTIQSACFHSSAGVTGGLGCMLKGASNSPNEVQNHCSFLPRLRDLASWLGIWPSNSDQNLNSETTKCLIRQSSKQALDCQAATYPLQLYYRFCKGETFALVVHSTRRWNPICNYFIEWGG